MALHYSLFILYRLGGDLPTYIEKNKTPGNTKGDLETIDEEEIIAGNENWC